jgi:4-hydroxybenzoate polyprenyltransferase
MMSREHYTSRYDFVKRVQEYAKLFRVAHYLKNLLVFIPLFFSLSFYEIDRAFACVMGFIVFSLLASVVYIINDLKDVEKDRGDDGKRKRPLAAGTISPRNAIKSIFILFIILIFIICFMDIPQNKWPAVYVLTAYFALNIGYSFGAKHIPIIDITILASGYILRVVFGGIIVGVSISFWLYLVVLFCAFYLGLGKRRNEIIKQGESARPVLKGYTYNFLDKNMYVCQALCIVFYALWSIDDSTIQRMHTSSFVFTVPIVFLILLKYSLNVERSADGDPITVLTRDKSLCALIILYVVAVIIIVLPGIGGRFG